MFDELLRIANRDTVDVLHDEYFLGAILRIRFETVEEGDVLIEFGEFGEILGFLIEVRFLEEGLPELLDHVAQVNDLVVLHEALCMFGERAHHIDVLRHGDTDAGALHLDGDELTALAQDRPMHLRKRSTAEGRGVDFREDLLAAFFAIDGVERREDFVEGERVTVHLELRKLLAVCGWQYFGACRERLPDLDEARTELLEHGAHFDGANALEGMVAAYDAQQLA